MRYTSYGQINISNYASSLDQSTNPIRVCFGMLLHMSERAVIEALKHSNQEAGAQVPALLRNTAQYVQLNTPLTPCVVGSSLSTSIVWSVMARLVDKHGQVAVGIISFYGAILGITFKLVLRHGFRRESGWIFLFIFSISTLALSLTLNSLGLILFFH